MEPIKAQTSEIEGMGRQASKHEHQGGLAPLVGRSPGAFVFASAFGPRIMMAPPGDGGDGGSGGGDNAGAGAGSADDKGGDSGDKGAGADKGAGNGDAKGDDKGTKPARPDYIPENFWDAEKGFKSDDFNALVAFKAEHDSNAALVPEKPDGYQLALPKDFKLPEGFELPEGQEIAIDEADPRLGPAREFAHAKGFSQSQFEELVAMGVQMDIAEQANIKRLVDEQAEKLGPNGKARISAVTTWLGAKLGGEFAQALAPMLYTEKQVKAFERLMQLNRGDVPGNPGAGRDSGKTEISDEEYNKMSPTERINYARQHSKK
ncbi:hypothetical protein J2T08_000560 [Neorhizobium galegae]|uniref:hypothetical protein n=1 Tax=Neorhizobium galegae TaxID=399 RepID=UPI0027885E32|nr:hypothetical protein [Neorhizobium galegae]MDQ0132659.1 hypothetical protein [Neorhizobium galegae]